MSPPPEGCSRFNPLAERLPGHAFVLLSRSDPLPRVGKDDGVAFEKGIRVKRYILLGVALIVLGTVGLVYGGIDYASAKTVIELGSMEPQPAPGTRLAIPPILGGVAVLVGVALVLTERRGRQRGGDFQGSDASFNRWN